MTQKDVYTYLHIVSLISTFSRLTFRRSLHTENICSSISGVVPAILKSKYCTLDNLSTKTGYKHTEAMANIQKQPSNEILFFFRTKYRSHSSFRAYNVMMGLRVALVNVWTQKPKYFFGFYKFMTQKPVLHVHVNLTKN